MTAFDGPQPLDDAAHPQLLHHLLDGAARRYGERIAIISDDGALTYTELASASKRIARWLLACGIQRGDRVAMLMPNGIAVATTVYAASRIGAIFTVLEPGLKPYGLAQILEDCEPKLVLTEPGRDVRVRPGMRVHRLRRGWERTLPDAEDLPVALAPTPEESVGLVYTSGTTSAPKAVEATHEQILFVTQAIQAVLAMRSSDVVGDFLPLSFDVGLYQLFLCCQVGATLALGRPDDVGPVLLKKLKRWNVTALPMVPTIAAVFVRLASRQGTEPPRLRFVTSTGAHLALPVIRALRELLPDCLIYSMYGLTECKRVAILPPHELESRPTSVGYPLPGTRCDVVDEDGNPVSPGEQGELIVYGPHLMLGYWRAPELTSKRYRTGPDGRALHTGDVCSMDAEGYIYFHGRRDDIYKYRDRRVSTTEVEAATLDISGVLEAVVVPPHDARGPVVFVTGDVTDSVVSDGLRERLEDAKLPARVVVVERLPLRATGKVDRAALAELADTVVKGSVAAFAGP